MAIKIEASSTEKEEVKKEINEEIVAFQEWFQTTVENTPLMRAEESILRTYLQYRLLSSSK